MPTLLPVLEGPFLQDFLKTASQPSSRPSQATKGSHCLSAIALSGQS